MKAKCQNYGIPLYEPANRHVFVQMCDTIAHTPSCQTTYVYIHMCII